ncbi:MAG TPA: aldehyde dehydrogenase family protein, partial [bacterium]|nr:aldehyde dehydrogenase family protein [bacterium]
MPAADEIRRVVEEVLKSIPLTELQSGTPAASRGCGVFADVESAVRAAGAAQRELISLPLDARTRMIEAIRSAVLAHNESLSRDAVAETGLGNVRDKQVKNALAAQKTPGVEDVGPSAFSDEHGLTLTERAPFGVIGAVTPVTNPIATITSNSIGMIAAG